jgi:hypothetical protein
MMSDVVRRIGKALRQMQDAKLVIGSKTKRVSEDKWRLSN